MDEITTVVTVVVIATGFGVPVDAIGIGVKKGQITGLFDMGPAGWFFSCLLLWIVAFPAYLVKRQKLKEINEQDRSDESLCLRRIVLRVSNRVSSVRFCNPQEVSKWQS